MYTKPETIERRKLFTEDELTGESGVTKDKSDDNVKKPSDDKKSAKGGDKK